MEALLTKYFLHIIWFFFCLFCLLVDAKLWNKKEDDPEWLRENFSWFWLVGLPATFFFAQDAGWIMKDFFVDKYGEHAWIMFKLHSLVTGFGMSIVWDLGYSKIEKGAWIAPLPFWLTIPFFWKKNQDDQKDRIVIGFTYSGMIKLNLFRLLLLILSAVILY